MQKVLVTFPNGSNMIVTERIVQELFEGAEVKVEPVGEDFSMTATEVRRHNNQFSSLVGGIDAKWGHTYEPLANDSPKMTDNMRAYLDRLVEEEGYYFDEIQ